MSPTVIAYNEIYNAIQNNVIEAGENEAAGVEQMRFFEVAPQLSMTQHAITIRPLCFSPQTLAKLPNDLQAAIAGPARRPAPSAAQTESGADGQILETLEKAGKLHRVRVHRTRRDEAAGGSGDGRLCARRSMRRRSSTASMR